MKTEKYEFSSLNKSAVQLLGAYAGPSVAHKLLMVYKITLHYSPG